MSLNGKGFLFDLDGTLVNSLPVVERAWLGLAKRLGLSPQAVLDFIHGKQAITSLHHFMSGRSEAEIQQEFKRLEHIEAEDIEGIVALPGAIALLNRLNELAVPWAIVTSGTIPVAHARCKAAGIPLPNVFITAEQVTYGKPNPDAYLLGAKRLGFMPADCFVVEDAQAGLASGLAAGCQVIAVNAPANITELTHVVKSLHSLTQIVIEREDNGVKLRFHE